MTHASVNGEIFPIQDISLPLDSLQVVYGFGVYETLKLRNKKIYFIEDHIDRLFQSAKIITLEHTFTKNNTKKWITELIEKNNVTSTNIKIILLGADTKEKAKLYIFLTNPLFIEKKEYRLGVKTITFEYERFAPQAKSLNMLPSYIAYKKAKQSNCYDALLLNKRCEITEGTRSNFFAIKNNTLFSPPNSEILQGITRKTVLECAIKNNYSLVEQPLPFSKIFSYDGAFLTNTSGKIVPIKTINNQSFKEITKSIVQLKKLYNQYLKLKIKD